MNVNEISSDFQFLGNRVVEFLIKTDDAIPSKLHIDTDIDYNINSISEKEDMLVGTLDFLVNIAGNAADGSVSLSIKLVMEGCFIAKKEKIDIETFKELIEKNGLIALSQISRSFLISATSLSGISPAIKLPMINVLSLIKKKKKN